MTFARAHIAASVWASQSRNAGFGVRIEDAEIAGVKVITPAKHGDHRGFFSEVYNRRSFEEAGLALLSCRTTTPSPPRSGRSAACIFNRLRSRRTNSCGSRTGACSTSPWISRRSSKTFGRHFAIELSRENWRQLLVPVGFAHGFCTLEPDTEVLYKVTNYYSAANDFGLAFDDPALGIDWGVDLARARLSEKDRRQPRLADLSVVFD